METFSIGVNALAVSPARIWYPVIPGSSVQNGVSSTVPLASPLTVSDGAQVAHLSLIGSYVSSDFHLATDAHGGTYVDDPRTTPAATRFAEAMAGFSGRYQALAAIYASGTALVSASHLFAAGSSAR